MANVRKNWFGYFGLPKILQSDNGNEFKNKLFVNEVCSWEGECKIVYGRPRHPQSQGLVEQANGTVEVMISAMMEQEKHRNWPSLLPRIMYVLNTSKSSSTKFMPYEVTFNRKPNRGESKKFTMIDNKDKEVDVELDTPVEPVNIAPSCSKEIESDEEIPISKLSDRIQSQKTADLEILNENKVSNGDKMIKKHDHKRNKVTREFNVGSMVTVRIPRIDRAGSDFRRMPGIVCQIKTHGDRLHHLITEYGTLNDWYRTGDLEPLVGGVIKASVEDYNSRMVSMTEAAKLQAACTGSLEAVKAMCNCNTGCQQDNRCTCFKLKLKCTSHCHAKLVTGKSNQKVAKKKCLNRD